MKRRNFPLHAADLLQLVERHDDRASLEPRAAMIDRHHRESRALNLKRVARFLVKVLGQKVAQHHFGLTIPERLSRQQLL